MRQKRVFIAINLPTGVRDELEHHIADLVTKVFESVRFVPPEFLHFTLTFLGNQTDEDIGGIIGVMREIVPQFVPPEIAITNIAYGPPGRPPRMIWAVTDEATSQALGDIKAALEDALAERGVRFERETKKYNAHLTLARLPAGQAGFEYGQNLPSIDALLAIRFIPESVDLMESNAKKSGAEYTLFTEVEFSKDLM